MEEIMLRLEEILSRHGCSVFGYADLSGFVPNHFNKFNRAVSFGLAMDPKIMIGMENGPTPVYASLYISVNQKLDSLSDLIASEIRKEGWRAHAIPASVRADPVNLKGDFPHKTAATRAGLGWIGKNALLVTKSIGPWVRLSTVLTDLPLPPGKPVENSSCGKCDQCVTACPAGALYGAIWIPGLARNKIIDVHACDRYKKTHFFVYNQGRNCGICAAGCPLGKKTLKALKCR